MNIDNELDALKRIKQIEVPPFLLTRIKHKIQNLGNGSAPVKWKWAFATSTIIILALNFSFFLTRSGSDKNADIETVVSSLQLADTNALYNE